MNKFDFKKLIKECYKEVLTEIDSINIKDLYIKQNDELDTDEYKQINNLEKSSGISILSDKDLKYAYFINNIVVGVLYDAYNNEEYSFDVIVNPEYRRLGIGKKIIDDAIDEYKQVILDMDSDAKLKLEVVNPNLVTYLKNKGFDVINKVDGTTIMVYKNIDEITQKNIKSKFPLPNQLNYLNNTNKLDLTKLTLDNLKSLRDKVARQYKYLLKNNKNNIEDIDDTLEEFKYYNDEINNRIKNINNKPIEEYLLNSIPKEGNYIIVGITFPDGDSYSGIDITGNNGHASLKINKSGELFDKAFYWRYKSINNILYVDSSKSQLSDLLNKIIVLIISHLKSKYNIIPVKINKNIDSYSKYAHQINK